MILQQTAKRAATRAAFTLMEMLVVVAIIVILAGVGVPAYLGYLESARVDTCKAGIKNIDTAVKAWAVRYNELPTDLSVLIMQSPDGLPAKLREKDLYDPWGQMYVYDPNQFDLNTGTALIYSVDTATGQQRPGLSNWEI